MTQFRKTTKSTHEYYTKNAVKFYNDTVNVDMESLYQPFLKHVHKKGSILDAGCGSGRDSLNFIKKGFVVTAFDFSEEFVKLASNLTGTRVRHMSFDDIIFDEEFDGIWACASLIHVPKNKMAGIMSRLARSLKKNGVMFASFKYGDKEEFRNDRLFNDYNEDNLHSLIEDQPALSMIKYWKTEDTRKDRKGMYWMNLLFKKSR